MGSRSKNDAPHSAEDLPSAGGILLIGETVLIVSTSEGSGQRCIKKETRTFVPVSGGKREFEREIIEENQDALSRAEGSALAAEV